MNYEYGGQTAGPPLKRELKKCVDNLLQETSTEHILTSHHSENRTNLTKEGYLGPSRVKSLEILLLAFSAHSTVTH